MTKTVNSVDSHEKMGQDGRKTNIPPVDNLVVVVVMVPLRCVHSSAQLKNRQLPKNVGGRVIEKMPKSIVRDLRLMYLLKPTRI